MQKLFHSFMSSNDGNVESPNVSPERRQRIKEINKLSLNPNQLSSSGTKHGGPNVDESKGNHALIEN